MDNSYGATVQHIKGDCGGKIDTVLPIEGCGTRV
jgi:hypothetical protein